MDEIERLGREAGLDLVGVCSSEPFPEVRADIERRKADGTSGRLRFTYADPVRSTDVATSFPWARRLVVGASCYLPRAGDPGPPRARTGRIARFAIEDAYAPLRKGLEAIATAVRGHGHRAQVLIDDGRLVDRAAAVRAGIAWWGKNTMVLSPGYGPWLLLGSVVTDLLLPLSPRMLRDCGTCTACLPACPTGALIEPGTLDATRCLAYWAQAAGVIPTEYRTAMADRIYGCEDCLEACPPGGRLLETARTNGRGRVDLLELLAASDRELVRRYGHFYIPRREARYLRRNALLALGNTGGRRAVGVLAGYLGHHDRILRVHAAWALGRLGGAAARAALAAQLRRETDPLVADEIIRALADRPDRPEGSGDRPAGLQSAHGS